MLYLSNVPLIYGIYLFIKVNLRRGFQEVCECAGHLMLDFRSVLQIGKLRKFYWYKSDSIWPKIGRV